MTTTVTAQDNAPKVLISEAGRKGDPGTDGTDGAGFNQVRKSLIDNPLCHLFKTNKLVEASAPTGTDSDVTWTRSTTATYVDRYGIVQTAAIDTPREEKEGFLIEGASTNLALYSQDFSNAAWQKIGGSTVNSAVGEQVVQGVNSDKFNATASSDELRQTVAFTDSGQDLTFSIIIAVDANSQTEIRTITVTGGTTQNYSSTFDASTGLFTNEDANHTLTSKLLGFGFYRVSATMTANNTGNTTAQIRVLQPEGAGSIFIASSQIEELPFASSYIPTTTAATRTADNVSVAIENNLPNIVSDSFSISINTSLLTLTDNPILFDFRNSAFERVYVDGGGSIVLRDSVSDFIIYNNGLASNQEAIVTLAFDGSVVSCYVDGVLGVTPQAYSFTNISTSNPLQIYSFNGALNWAYGNIHGLRTYGFKVNQDEVTYLSGV